MEDYKVNCCKQMRLEVKRENLITILGNIPFTPIRRKKPTAYIQSDGGQGGLSPIEFCPFCGTKIEIKVLKL